MTDVAKAAGVSLKTVSRVVNRVPTVDPVLAGRVNDVIERLGFTPNMLAAHLKAGSRTGTIAIVASDCPTSVATLFVRGIGSVARTHATHLIAAVSPMDVAPGADELRVIQDLIARRVDGIVVVTGTRDHSRLASEARRGVPFVFLDRPPHGLQADAVLAANRDGGREAARRLIAQGHERIGVLVSTPARESQFDRWTGAREAIAEAGLLLSQCPQLTGLSELSAARATSHLLDSPRPPTALLALDSEVAMGAARALLSRPGTTRVPLATFDQVALLDLLPLPIEMCFADAVEMGRQAARLLFARLDGDERPARHLSLPVRFVRSGAAGNDAPGAAAPGASRVHPS